MNEESLPDYCHTICIHTVVSLLYKPINPSIYQLFIYLYIYLSLSVFISIFICMSVYLSIYKYPLIYLSFFKLIYLSLSIHPYIYLSVYLSIYPLSIYLYIQLTVCINPSIHLFFYPSIFYLHNMYSKQLITSTHVQCARRMHHSCIFFKIISEMVVIVRKRIMSV